MNSRERVLAAIDHEEPDKVPIDSWLAPEVSRQLCKLLRVDTEKDPFALGKALGNDWLYGFVGMCCGYGSIDQEDRRVGENLYQCPWGIKWRRQYHSSGSYAEFAEHPLADIRRYESYRWPNPAEVEKGELEKYQKLIEASGKEYAVLGAVPCTIFEASWYLRGLENFLMDLYENRDFAVELFDRTMGYHLWASIELVRMGVDVIWWGDDIANEKGPYIDPKLYREMLKPRQAHMIQEVKKINKNVKIAFHSDGKIGWALDDLVEIGFDIINPLQPDVNDSVEVKRRYGKSLTIWGNVDTRHVMSKGNCSDVVEEVRKVIRTLAPGGGLILCSNHQIQSTPRAVDNTIAYYWAADKLRNYPIRL